MTRALTGAERRMLLAMIERGKTDRDQPDPTAADRSSWRAHASRLAVGSRCECGQCPSISLTATDTLEPGQTSRVVLTAGLPDAIVLLHVEAGVPDYLELAPVGNDVCYREFPDPSVVSF